VNRLSLSTKLTWCRGDELIYILRALTTINQTHTIKDIIYLSISIINLLSLLPQFINRDIGVKTINPTNNLLIAIMLTRQIHLLVHLVKDFNPTEGVAVVEKAVGETCPAM
jgi:hypothetical protein